MLGNVSRSSLVVVLSLAVAQLAFADTEIVGYVDKITTRHVWIGGQVYPLVRGDTTNLRLPPHEATECLIGQRITCGTLAGVGYIDKARVTVRNGVALRIEVLEQMQ